MDKPDDHDGQDARKLDEVARDLRQRAQEKEAEIEHLKEEMHDLEEDKHELVEEAEEAEKLEHEIENNNHQHDDAFKIGVVVNGVKVDLEVRPDEHLAAVRSRALKETNNLGRPAEDWDIKTEGNVPLDPQSTVEAAGIRPDTLLFISPKAGVAGA